MHINLKTTKMNFLKVISSMALLSLLSFSCSKEKRAFNKLEGEWNIEKIEYLENLEADTFSLPTGGTIQFDDCSYNQSIDGVNGGCSFSYKFKENQNSQEGEYQLTNEPGNTETGFWLGLQVISNDTINEYKITNGGNVSQIDKSNLVFETFLFFVKEEYSSRVKIYCKK